MGKTIYKITAHSILCDALNVEGKLLSLVSDYYKDSPDEAGKTDTEFYRHMSLIIDSIERSVDSDYSALNVPLVTV